MKSDIKPFYGIVIIGRIRHITDSIKWLKKRVGIYICVIEIEELKIEKYLLDGYVCGERKVIQVEGKEYEIQKYQGEHQNEYLISEMKNGKVEGRCELFDSGLLTLSWIMKDGKRIGLTEYEKGKVLVKKGWESVLGEGDYRIIENNKEEMELVIRDKNDTMIYQGEFDEELNRHGKGIEYDENGKLKYEGYWKRDELICILREFRGDEMIEYEDCDNSDVFNRIPLYIGGYTIVCGEFKRNGIGYLIDRENGTAIRESEWFNGKELSGIDLFDGWYVKGMNESIRCVLNNEQPVITETIIGNQTEVHNSKDLSEISLDVEGLVTDSFICNDLTSLNLNTYDLLKSIVIGDYSFRNVLIFNIDGLNELKSLKIGKNSFTKKENSRGNDRNRSFGILNCNELKSIEIGQYSFSDYAGGFELKNLPKISTIKIGQIGKKSSKSYNFYSCALTVNDLPNLNLIELGNNTFEHSLSTVISNLPNLKSIKLGEYSLHGRNDSSCSLTMENLPKLMSITSVSYSFEYPRIVTLSNIPNLKIVNLPISFKYVQSKPITNVSPILADLVKIRKDHL